MTRVDGAFYDDEDLVVTEQPVIKSTTRPFPASIVVVDGTLAHRLAVFNIAIERLTIDLLRSLGAQINASSSIAAVAAAAKNRRWNNELVFSSARSIVVVNSNDYLETLTTRRPLVKVLILPWLSPSRSYADSPNLDVQVRYDVVHMTLVDIMKRNGIKKLIFRQTYSIINSRPKCDTVSLQTVVLGQRSVII